MTEGRVIYDSNATLSRGALVRLVLVGIVLLSIPATGLFLMVDRPRPPARPSGVPPTAAAFLQDFDRKVWWWGQCEALGSHRYRCRLYDASGGVAVSGEYVARAGQCRGRSGSSTARLPYAGEYLEFRAYEQDGGRIRLTTPCGVYLEE